MRATGRKLLLKSVLLLFKQQQQSAPPSNKPIRARTRRLFVRSVLPKTVRAQSLAANHRIGGAPTARDGFSPKVGRRRRRRRPQDTNCNSLLV